MALFDARYFLEQGAKRAALTGYAASFIGATNCRSQRAEASGCPGVASATTKWHKIRGYPGQPQCGSCHA